MRTTIRWVAAGILTLAVACGGVGPTDEPSGGGGTIPQGSMAGQAMWPAGDENPDAVFQQADAAFQSGRYIDAQRMFGILFIIAPDYRAGIATSALIETCRAIPNNCDFVIPRLEFLRDAYYGTFTPRPSWPPQQERDFGVIMEGYDLAIIGDLQTAVQACGSVTQSPLPGFASAATYCAQTADAILVELQRSQMSGQALQDWNSNYPCMEEHREDLMATYDAGDWEGFVDIYPQYQQCASVLREIIDSEVLMGHPDVDDWDYNLAWSHLDEVRAIMEDNRATFDQVNDALIELDSDPNYNSLVIEWESYEADIEGIESQIASLEVARDALSSGPDRSALTDQIDALQSELRETRRQMRDVMGRINSLRRDAGLEARERP